MRKLLSEHEIRSFLGSACACGELAFRSAEPLRFDAWPAYLLDVRRQTREHHGLEVRKNDLARPPVAELRSSQGIYVWAAGSDHMPAALRGLARGDSLAVLSELAQDAVAYVESYARGENGPAWLVVGTDADAPSPPRAHAELVRSCLRSFRTLRAQICLRYALAERARVGDVPFPFLEEESAWLDYPGGVLAPDSSAH